MCRIDWLIFALLNFFTRTCQFFTIWNLLLTGNSNVEDEYFCDIAYLEWFTFNKSKGTREYQPKSTMALLCENWESAENPTYIKWKIHSLGTEKCFMRSLESLIIWAHLSLKERSLWKPLSNSWKSWKTYFY